MTSETSAKARAARLGQSARRAGIGSRSQQSLEVTRQLLKIRRPENIEVTTRQLNDVHIRTQTSKFVRTTIFDTNCGLEGRSRPEIGFSAILLNRLHVMLEQTERSRNL